MDDASAGGKEVQACPHLARLHPTGQVPPGVANGIHQGRQFERERFLSRAAAKIIIHGADNVRLPFK
jgi:hypothetical protein